jgi:hypothetical protein
MGYAEHPAEWWEGDRRTRYLAAEAKPTSRSSTGHPDECGKYPACEKCFAHDTYAALEREAGLSYLGCVGLEDQLQALVPETIGDALRAGIRVWMITGDKLEAARNIGLACNLIDMDMVPRFRDDASIDQNIDSFQNSRLIEVTGQWRDIATNKEALAHLFDIFDRYVRPLAVRPSPPSSVPHCVFPCALRVFLLVAPSPRRAAIRRTVRSLCRSCHTVCAL